MPPGSCGVAAAAFGGAATNAGDGIEAGAQAGRRPNGRQDPGDDLQLLEVLRLGAAGLDFLLR